MSRRTLLLCKHNSNFNYIWAPSVPCSHVALFLWAESGGGRSQPRLCPVGMEAGGDTEVAGDPRGAGWRSPVGVGLLLLTEQRCMHIGDPNLGGGAH